MEFVLLLILLVLSAFFSGSETAYFSLRPFHLARLARQDGRSGRRVIALVERANTLLSALLIGNLLVNTAASVVATAVCVTWWGQNGLVVAVPVITMVLLLFGEITPKMIALGFRRRLALITVRPLSLWVGLTSPLVNRITAVIDRLLDLFPFERARGRNLNREELETACDLAVARGALTETEGRFLARLLQLEHLEVHQIMTPRPDVKTLAATASRQSIREMAQTSGFNRFPVTSAARPQPIGVFHLKDMVGHEAVEFPLAEGDLHPLLFVPESKDVAALLAEMRTGGGHLAAVIDEHGDFSGIVTMADCLQALLGAVGDVPSLEIQDATQLGAGHWVLSGRMDLREMSELTSVTLPVSRDYVTITGFLMARLGRVLRPGDEYELSSARFRVLEMHGHKVKQIELLRLRTDPPGGVT
ncbi:MAG: hemolysin family protein [bacterium]